MSDVGGAGDAGGCSGASSAGNAGDVGGPESCGANAEASAAVDGAMNDVSSAEVSAAAESVTGKVDGYQEAGICIGTETECAKEFQERAQREADQMTEEQAIQALDGAFLHDPRSL